MKGTTRLKRVEMRVGLAARCLPCRRYPRSTRTGCEGGNKPAVNSKDERLVIVAFAGINRASLFPPNGLSGSATSSDFLIRTGKMNVTRTRKPVAGGSAAI
jgi:hypothetical protein